MSIIRRGDEPCVGIRSGVRCGRRSTVFFRFPNKSCYFAMCTLCANSAKRQHKFRLPFIEWQEISKKDYDRESAIWKVMTE